MELRSSSERCRDRTVRAAVHLLKYVAFDDEYTFEERLTDGEKILIASFLTNEGRKLSEEPPQPAMKDRRPPSPHAPRRCKG